MSLTSYLPRSGYINLCFIFPKPKKKKKNDVCFIFLGGPVQWKFCHFPETDVKADALGKPHGWGWATRFNGFFGLTFPLFSRSGKPISMVLM